LAKAVKGQAIADFITHHREGKVTLLELTPWALFFDGSTCKQGGGVSIVSISPQGICFEYAIPIKLTSTNNQVEYEAILKGIQLLHEVKAKSIEIFGDSQLVINRLLGLYERKLKMIS
jgi:ribonuclease HI